MKISEIGDLFKNVSYEEALILHTVAGIALHPQIGEDLIEDVYEQRKKEYLNEYRNSPYYGHTFFKGIPTTKSVRIQKLLAMYLLENKNSNGKEFLMKYIISGYKKVYDYVQNNPKISLNSLLHFYMEKQFENLPESHKSMIAAIAMYIAEPSKEIDEEPVLRTQLHNMMIFSTDLKGTDAAFSKRRTEKEMEALRAYQKVSGTKFGKVEQLEALLGKHESYISKNLITKDELRTVITKGNFDPIYQKGLHRYWKTLTAILRFYNINDMHFDVVDITRDDLIDIYTLFTIAVEKGRLKEDEFELFLVSSFVNLMMAKQYIELSDKYLSLFEKESGLSQLEAEYNYQEELNQFKQTEKEMHKQISKQQLLLDAQQKEIEELKRKLKEIEQQNQESELLKKEVVSLRDYVFNEGNEEYLEDTDTLDSPEYKKLLEGKKIAIFGGHPKWHQKIKEILPFVRTVAPEELSIDLSFVANMDIVCIETTYNNHSQYHRVLNQLDKNHTKLLYVNEKNVTIFLNNLIKISK